MGPSGPDRGIPVALLEEWRGLLLRYGDEAAYTQLRADAEGAVARWVWAANESQLHRIEPFVRELQTMPEPKLLREAPRPPVNAELYGYDRHDRIVLVRTYDDTGDESGEEFLLHAPDEITSIGFSSMDPPSRPAMRRWRLCEGRVQELIEAPGTGTEEATSPLSVTHYLHEGERVERMQKETFDLSSGDRSDDSLTIPTYAGDGRVLELRWRESPIWQKEFVVYRRPPEDLPELDAQRAALASKLTETIAEAVICSHPPDRLYGLVLAYGDSLPPYVAAAALFEAARRYRLEGGEEPQPPEAVVDPGDLLHVLWDPTWAEPEDYLPDGVDPAPYDRQVLEDAVQEPLVDSELNRAFCEYQRTGALIDRDNGHSAVTALWREVATRLTKLDWNGRLDVTDDFVVLAYPYDPPDDDIRAALEHSLTPARFAELEAKGWIPGPEDL